MEPRPKGQRRPALHDGLLDPLPLLALWPRLNRTHHVDGAAVRLACLFLLVVYVVSSFIRHLPDPAILAIRAAVVAYTVIGIILGPRFRWPTLRAYTVGMALLLPATTAALEILRGNHPADLAITALAIFTPIVFLQTGVDVVIVFAVLLSGIGALVSIFGPPGVPVEVAGIVLGGALVAAATTALVLIAFRGRVSESTAWWQEACARERALREFVELAAPHLGDQVLAREFAARFRSAFGGGHCAVVLRDDATAELGVAATAGAAPLDGERAAAANPAALAELLATLTSRQPLVCDALSADDVQGRFGALPWLRAGGTLVLLPIADDGVTGAIVLSAAGSRPVTEEEVLLWKAMANQVGVAVRSARLFMHLQEALRARSEFINTMSHELRSPLHVILGYADMLAEQTPTAHVAARVRASAWELLQLVENTLAVAHLGSGKMRLQPTEFPLGELIGELRESVAALPETTTGVALRWEVADDLPIVRMDRLKSKEIVHNLVSNALKFTTRGEVVVRVSCAQREVRIEVDDTGSGIPHEAQARIFEMFERIEPPPGRRAPGVGLGLYIVKSLTQMMGGTVTLDSEPGRGSRFVVRLPVG